MKQAEHELAKKKRVVRKNNDNSKMMAACSWIAEIVWHTRLIGPCKHTARARKHSTGSRIGVVSVAGNHVKPIQDASSASAGAPLQHTVSAHVRTTPSGAQPAGRESGTV
jgi:hypothetical protein